MKAWVRLALAAGIVLCLLLSLGPQVILPPMDRYGTCGNQKEAASSSPTTWGAARAAVHDAVAALRESVVFDGALAAPALGPPGGETHRPPEIVKGLDELAAKPSGQSNEQVPCSGVFLSALPFKS